MNGYVFRVGLKGGIDSLRRAAQRERAVAVLLVGNEKGDMLKVNDREIRD